MLIIESLNSFCLPKLVRLFVTIFNKSNPMLSESFWRKLMLQGETPSGDFLTTKKSTRKLKFDLSLLGVSEIQDFYKVNNMCV